MSVSAIILAGGRGLRMGGDVPKQYRLMAGLPVLYYSLRAFSVSGVDEIVLVCGAGDEDYCRSEIVEKFHFFRVSAIVAGGSERVESVYNGLTAAGGEYVLIHDGARAFIRNSLIDEIINEVKVHDAVITAVPCSDTIKRVSVDGVILDTPMREELYAVQTPQAFHRDLIMDCYEAYHAAVKGGGSVPAITDDSMLVERYSDHPVRMIRGDRSNIKITTPEDLEYGEFLLRGEQSGITD